MSAWCCTVTAKKYSEHMLISTDEVEGRIRSRFERRRLGWLYTT